MGASEEMGSSGAEATGGGGADVPSAEADCASEGACGDGRLCDVYDCGGRPARYNHFGCPRVACGSHDDCPSGEACFALAFDRICEPSTTMCFEDDGACVCEATSDCDGVLDAHCLPTEFYPPAAYCDVASRGCDELAAWADVLLRAAAHHDEVVDEAQDGSGLGASLRSCAAEAAEALGACS